MINLVVHTSVCCMTSSIWLLTVGTSVDFHSHAYLSIWIPLQGHKANKAGSHRVQQLVVNHTVSIQVSSKCLKRERNSVTYIVPSHVKRNMDVSPLKFLGMSTIITKQEKTKQNKGPSFPVIILMCNSCFRP